MTEGEMVGWHHRLNGHEFEQAPGVGDGQEAWCAPVKVKITQSCLTVCDTMNRSTPGLPVHHQLPEFTQTQVHQVDDAIQSSHPLSSPFPPAPNPSQHQSFPMSQLFA